MLVRVISYTFTDARIPGAGEQVYRLVTTLLDPFLYPAKELAVLFHERWHAELVIGETRTVLRLSARTLRSLTPQGVIQELYALLLAHTLLRTLMLRAATQQGIAPTTLSLTGTIRILDESLLPLGMVHAARRHTMVLALLDEIGQQRSGADRERVTVGVDKPVAKHPRCGVTEDLDRSPLVLVEEETILDLLARHVDDLFDDECDVLRGELSVQPGLL